MSAVGNKIKISRKLLNIRTITFLIVLLAGLIYRLGSFIQDRTLWYDEAMLASSILQRGFGGLFEVLDYSQSAPIGFLIIIKALVTVFGSSQYIIRLYSLLTGIGAIWLFYLLIKDAGFKRPLISAAFFATIYPLIYYSTELKPYMQDAFFAITALYLYQLYTKDRIPVWVYMLFSFLSVWISFPVIFVIAAIACYNFFIGLGNMIMQKKHSILDNRELVGGIVFGISALAGFLVCYVVYTGNVTANVDEMSMEYWKYLNFPFMPKEDVDWELMVLMIRNYLEFAFPGVFASAAAGVLWFGGLLLLYIRKREFFWYSYLIVFFTIFASSLGKYPIQGRLLLFMVPFTAIGIICFVEVMLDLIKWRGAEIIIFAGVVALNISAIAYSNVNNLFKERQEATQLIKYLKNNIEDEKLYIFSNAVPIYEYMMGYKNGFNHFPEEISESGHLIFGSKYWNLTCEPYVYHTTIDEEKLSENVESVIKYPKAYILFYHQGGDAENSLISTLKQYGTVILVMTDNNTPLYLFIRYVYL